MSDMSRINLRGDVSGQVVVGDRNVVISARDGAQVSYRAEGPPRVRPRPFPLGAPQPRQAALIGRDAELAAIGRWLAGGRAVQVFGPPGIGKSALLHRFAADRAARGDPVVRLTATGTPLEDLLQELFHTCYETESGREFDGYKPEPAALRRLLGALRVLLVVDDLTATSEDLALLRDMTGGCALLTASAEWTAGFDGRPMRLEGLPADDAFALLVRELGRTPRGPEADAARRLIATVQGHPQTLVQTAAALNAAARDAWPPPTAFRIDENALAVGVAARLSPASVGLLRLLSALDPLPVPTVLLEVFGARPDRSAVAELTALRLVEADGEGFRSCGRFAALVARQAGATGDAARLAPPLIQWLRLRATRREAGAAAAVTGRVLAAAVWREDHTTARDLARAAAPLLALSLRWGAWRRVIEHGRTAAHTLGDAASESYFRHEAQKRRLALGGAAMGAGGGGGGAGYAAVQGGGGLGAGAPPPGGPPGPAPPPPGPPGGVPGHGPALTPGSAGARGARAAHRSLHSTVSAHPVAAGVGAMALAASGVVAAVHLAGSDSGPAVVASTPPAIPSDLLPSDPPTSAPEPSPSLSAPRTSTPPSTPPVVPGRPTGSDGSCPPVALGSQDFGAVTVGEQKTETESFSWLECDNEDALRADDPGNWSAALTSCPPASGQGGTCEFQVTFRPSKPGGYSTRVVIPADDGAQDVTLTVTGTGVSVPSTPVDPSSPVEPSPTDTSPAPPPPEPTIS
ncbi:ATP-binding protein [Streptomyces sp. NPDC046939]|uniref:ATP-binding protein n=1 Tax=Streptomyces sp. NPDC046939 TaxID=3155376 RepID=UPI0033D258C2